MLLIPGVVLAGEDLLSAVGTVSSPMDKSVSYFVHKIILVRSSVSILRWILRPEKRNVLH